MILKARASNVEDSEGVKKRALPGGGLRWVKGWGGRRFSFSEGD